MVRGFDQVLVERPHLGFVRICVPILGLLLPAAPAANYLNDVANLAGEHASKDKDGRCQIAH
jgi:hypothetical protein